ncbi:MAG: RNA pseudouridine synthase [Actinomycetales bacterium mxb001]|nr:MAG: RNA pseudouridine synthase [Actinomycetales bacterium mxb001]
MSDIRRFPVPEGVVGERIDAGLARVLGMSRSAVAALIDEGRVRIDDTAAVKSDRLADGQWIDVDLPAPAPARPPEPVEGMRIVVDDDDIVIVDKPVGVAAHPSPGWDGPTVIGGLAAAGYRISTSGAAERQGVVHRLDVGTTGLMVVAKSESAYTDLKSQFKERTVDKVYRAIAQGHLDPLSGTIDAPIDRHPGADYRMAVVAGGKPSVTHYDTLEAFPYASLLEVDLETGRTHQIRVHLSAVRHPLVGDLTYGADPTLADRLGLTRPALHAARLAFDHPATGERVVVESADPPDFAEALRRLAEGI